MGGIVLPLMVCLARMVDVSLGTLKLKAVMRGNKGTSFAIAFIEVIVYTLAASKAFEYIDEPKVLFMYALGYALGNYLGIILDEKLSKGNVLAIIITNHDGWKLADILREKGYRITSSKGYGINGNIKAELKAIIAKSRVKELQDEIQRYDGEAFITVLDVADVNRMDVRK